MYGTQHALIKFVEKWWEQLDYNKTVKTALLDLPKKFDCILHDFLIAELNAYSFGKNTLTLLFLILETENNLSRLKPITTHF